MYFSRFFKNYVPRKGHLVKGRQGVAGEIMDLRGDIDSTFLNYEQEGNLVKHNNSATTDPGPTDDKTKGYAVLSLWVNIISEQIYVCTDSSVGVADWKNITVTLIEASIGSVETKTLSSPPLPPISIGKRYLVKPPSAGGWIGHDNEVAEWTALGWIYVVPDEGDRVWVKDEDRNYVFNGSAWTFPEYYIDHNILLNLAAGNVHTQYQLRSEKNTANGYAGLDVSGEVDNTRHGTRAGGTLHATATAIIAGFMSAVDKSKLDGIAPGATNSPLSNTTPADVSKSASSAGVATEASRRDHKHDVSVAAPVSVGSSNQEGSASSLARSDHVHNHADQGGGSLHSAATTSVSGFMSSGDKSRLDGIEPGATYTPLSSADPENVSKSTASPGVATSASRRDHKHDINTGTPGSVGSSNQEGSSSSLARADHVHAHGNQGGGSEHAVVIAGGASGFMTGSDKTKLDSSGVLSGTAPVNVTKSAAAAGTAIEASKQDHKHDVSTAQPGTVSIGDSAAEGSSSSLARADHTHAVTAPAAPADVTKAAASTGSSSTPARADHKHDVSTGTPVSVGASNQEGSSTALARADHVHAGSSKSMYSWGNSSISTTTTTRYLEPGFSDTIAYTSPVQVRVPFAGTVKNMYIVHNSPAGNGNNVVYTLRKNGVATALTVTLASTGSTASDTTNSVSVAAGDYLDIEVTKAASIGTSPTDIMCTVEIDG